MKSKKISKKTLLTPENFPIRSSLGLLAYGDIAFTIWREVKTNNKENEKQQK